MIDRAKQGDVTAESELAGLPGIFSVDDHVVEPPDLWLERVERRYRERIPRVVRERATLSDDLGSEAIADVWYYEDVRFPMRRNMCAAGLSPQENESLPTVFDEFRPGAYESSARLMDMDLDGVEHAVLFPDTFVRFCGQRFLDAKDRDVALQCVRAYNDWLFDTWLVPSKDRLIPGAIVPLWDQEACVHELKRNAERGFRAVCFTEIPSFLGLPSLHSGAWEEFLSYSEGTGTVVLMHIGSSSVVRAKSMDAPMSVELVNLYTTSSISLSDWLMSGLFVRFPKLKVAYSEAQAGWIPFVVSRLDGIWRDGRKFELGSVNLPNPPSSYLAEHVYACVFDDETAFDHPQIFGPSNICFETDYPHPLTPWPNSRAAAWRQTRLLDTNSRERVLRTNALSLFGLA